MGRRLLIVPLILLPAIADAQTPVRFSIPGSPIELTRTVRRTTFFDAAGRRAAILGAEDGRLEAWVYPLKLFHDFRLTVSIDGADQSIDLSGYAHRVTARPESFTITYSHPQFTIIETIFSPIDEPGSIVLLDVDSSAALTVTVGFVPDLKPMWPAGLGGQYAAWNQQEKFFVISESRRKFNGLVGSPLAVSGSSTPAHMLGPGSVHFEIRADRDQTRDRFIPIIITGNADGRARAVEQYKSLSSNIESLYLKTADHYRRLREARTSVLTPDPAHNRAFEWAKVALDKGLVTNPDLGTGLIAGLGLSTDSARPGFGWFFGGDAFINSLAISGFGDFESSREAFRFLQKRQRTDGKMMHELSQSAAMIRWFEEYPYGYYHADTTPFYLVAFDEYLSQSGDLAFLNESWESLKSAYSYCVSADVNGDGLMDNTAAGLGASELGSLQENLLTDVFLAAVTVRAMRAMERLAPLVPDHALAKDAMSRSERGLASLNRGFWDEELKRHVFALTTKDGKNPEQTAWPGVALAFRLLDEARSEGTLQSLASSEISTDWGTRMLARTSRAYDPIAYNNGGVWPFLTGFVAMGEYEYHHSISAFHHLMQTARLVEADALGFCSEIWSGDYYRPLETSVPHQLFSSGMIISPFIRGLMGLRPAPGTQLELAPHLPAAWDWVELKRFRLGNRLLGISLRRSSDSLKAIIEIDSRQPLELTFAPALAPFTQVQWMTVNGRPTQFTLRESSQDSHAVVRTQVSGRVEIEMKFATGIEIDVPVQQAEIGQPTSGLKVLGVERGADQLNLIVEGQGGRRYRFRLRSAFDPAVDGATPAGSSGDWKEYEVGFEPAAARFYVRKSIRISIGGNKQPARRSSAVR